MADKVRFGISNVHYAVWDTTNEEYGTPVALPGAVQLTTTAEGDQSVFYADNVPYFTVDTNAGYSGSLEVALIDDAFMTNVLGLATDQTSGLTYESSDAKPKSIALMFEIKGDVNNRRNVLYNVTLSRPSTEANTQTESADPDTVTLDFTAIARAFTINNQTVNVIKAHMDSTNATKYANFMTAVPIPGVA